MLEDFFSNEKGKTLEAFIRENDVLLSALGVFGALVFFAKDLSGNFVSELLSFVLVGGMVLIWFEIWYKLPKPPERMAFRLLMFRNVLQWGATAVIMYWLLAFRWEWYFLLFIPLTAIVFFNILWTVQPIMRAFEITRNMFGIGVSVRTKMQKNLRVISFFFAFLFSLYAGIGTSIGANILLDVFSGRIKIDQVKTTHS